MGKNEKIRVIIALSITCVLFSSFEIVTKDLRLPAIPLNGLRFLIGGLFLSLVGFKDMLNQLKAMRPPRILHLLALGFLNVSISMLSLQFAVKLGKASTAAIIISSNVLFVSLISTFSGRMKMTIGRGLLLLTGIAGIILISYRPDKGDTTLGIILALFASVTFAIYTVLSKNLVESTGPVLINALGFTVNGIVLLAVTFPWYKADIIGFVSTAPIEQWMRLFFTGVGVTGIAYLTFFYALRRVEATTGSLIFYCKPAVAMFLAVVFLGERISPVKIIGVAIVVASVIGMTLILPGSRKARAPA